MISLKESEVKKFMDQDKEKFMNQINEICGNENNSEEKFSKLIHDVFCAGFESGVKMASSILRTAVKTICEPDKELKS